MDENTQQAPVNGEVVPYGAGVVEEYRARIVMAPEEAKALDESLRNMMKAVLRQDVDYGVIPGTGSKPSLLKPGAEKLLQWFGYGNTNAPTGTERDSEGRRLGITYRCIVTKSLPSGQVVTVASCDGYAGYDEDRFYTSAEQAEAKERANAERYRRQVNKSKFAEYRAPWNSVIKMCLAASTPLLVKSPDGEYLTEATRLSSWLSKPTAPQVHVPGPDGEWVPVTAMFRNGTQPVLRITLRDGTEHRVTVEHRFLTARGLIAAGDLRTGDVLTRRTIPLAGMKEPDPDFGWLVGLVIADGHTTRWGVRITLGLDEEHLASRAIWIGRRLGCPASYKQRADMKALEVRISGAAIIGLLNQFIAGKNSYDKHLRATAWRAGSDFLDGVLRGWLDGDGSWTERPGRLGYWRVGFTGHNNAWLRDLRVLGAVLGYRVNVRTGSSKTGGKAFGTFVGDVKLPASSHGNNANLSQVMSIEPDGETMTYDLEVGTPDHLYLLHDGTVTHNSQKRALVGAAIIATSASGLFTQDVEDMVDPGVAAAGVVASAAQDIIAELPEEARRGVDKWRREQGWPQPSGWDTAQWCAALVQAGKLSATTAAPGATVAAGGAGTVPGDTGKGDPGWDTVVASVSTFATDDDGKKLWSEVVGKRNAKEISQAAAEELKAAIRARWAELKDTSDAVEGTVVEPLDPADPWALKVQEITTGDDAEALIREVTEALGTGRMDEGKSRSVFAAIEARTRRAAA